VDLERFWSALADRYRLERELGRGGMATVYLVKDLRHTRPVALKLMHPELAAGLGTRRFLREIQLAAPLDHPHILPVYDSGEAAGQLWYVMPCVQGESLRERLRREVRLPVRDAVRIAHQIAEALEYAHARDVIHRDIKPENILLAQGYARLTDFGIAKALERSEERLTRVGFAVGTVSYMSPEQASGEAVDPRSDLYSLACVLYEMLAGETPYTGPSAHAIITRSVLGPVPLVRAARPEVPAALEALITRTLAPEPADRYDSAATFAEALEESLSAAAAPPPAGALERGRDAYRRRAWREAYTQLSACDRANGLDPEDLERLAITCSLLGLDVESADFLACAHHEFLGRDAPERAARAAFWLAFELMERGETARASGWIGRARRLLGDGERECVEQGYLLLPDAFGAMAAGDYQTALSVIARVAAIGERFEDPDLVALTRHLQGRALIRAGRAAEGVALLDEAMVAVTTDEVSPYVVGGVYCSVISGCQEIFDWRRAREWTEVLARWCAPQPDLVVFRGHCLLRRSEVLQLRGDWTGALEEVRRALARFLDPPGQIGTGAAYYQLAELHRLRGDLKEAEEAYRQASLHSRRTQPGLALLRMAQGDVGAALASTRRALDESPERRFRPTLLAASVEVALAAGDLDAARAAAEELAAIAADIGAPYLRALSAHARGAVELAAGDARAALGALREAETIWQELEAPYEAARTRVLIGRAGQAMGDAYEAELDLDAAGSVFERLGAATDLVQLQRSGSARPAT
jgi:tetratricopeptide (TPR) repeat protein/tRNA A-37 threonylcarbamoyl transferase component Bud32